MGPSPDLPREALRGAGQRKGRAATWGPAQVTERGQEQAYLLSL